ncbi:hypothetical protein RTM1035_05075 [Roseovarius sp. TM1035]|jgi:hypothetical protein|nr:hypothetical protein [Roseovarius sp. TM1035]AWZ21082.1 Hypothetical protein RAK1035_2374 [Roseovarius sp. AK1035]EDM32962.1 hypothetical protein RTM1035_05075 [Roseovarius sp. TM1035]
MTNLPTSGGSYTRDDKGALKRAEAALKPTPAPKPEKKDADK